MNQFQYVLKTWFCQLNFCSNEPNFVQDNISKVCCKSLWLIRQYHYFMYFHTLMQWTYSLCNACIYISLLVIFSSFILRNLWHLTCFRSIYLVFLLWSSRFLNLRFESFTTFEIHWHTFLFLANHILLSVSFVCSWMNYF